MLGARNLPTYLDVVNFENDLEKHHRKLGEIQKGQTKKKVLLDHHDAARLAQARSQNLRFHHSEKYLAIERDNELLLGRLVEISRKKQNPLFAVNEPVKQNKPLHATFRKKEQERIAAENEAFARRLLSQQPNLNRQKFDADYEKHAERVKLMQKWTGYTPRVKLPPIKYDKYEDLDKKTQSAKEKKTIKEIGKKKRRKSNSARIAEEEEKNEKEVKADKKGEQQEKAKKEKVKNEKVEEARELTAEEIEEQVRKAEEAVKQNSGVLEKETVQNPEDEDAKKQRQEAQNNLADSTVKEK